MASTAKRPPVRGIGSNQYADKAVTLVHVPTTETSEGRHSAQLADRDPIPPVPVDGAVPPDPHNAASVDEWSNRWRDVGIDNFVSERNGWVTLSKVQVPDEWRGQGIATRYMTDLCAYADRTGQQIALTPATDFGSSKARLTEFYKRFGFVENKGRNKDYETREAMLRNPTNS